MKTPPTPLSGLVSTGIVSTRVKESAALNSTSWFPFFDWSFVPSSPYSWIRDISSSTPCMEWYSWNWWQYPSDSVFHLWDIHIILPTWRSNPHFLLQRPSASFLLDLEPWFYPILGGLLAQSPPFQPIHQIYHQFPVWLDDHKWSGNPITIIHSQSKFIFTGKQPNTESTMTITACFHYHFPIILCSAIFLTGNSNRNWKPLRLYTLIPEENHFAHTHWFQLHCSTYCLPTTSEQVGWSSTIPMNPPTMHLFNSSFPNAEESDVLSFDFLKVVPPRDASLAVHLC